MVDLGRENEQTEGGEVRSDTRGTFTVTRDNRERRIHGLCIFCRVYENDLT